MCIRDSSYPKSFKAKSMWIISFYRCLYPFLSSSLLDIWKQTCVCMRYETGAHKLIHVSRHCTQFHVRHIRRQFISFLLCLRGQQHNIDVYKRQGSPLTSRIRRWILFGIMTMICPASKVSYSMPLSTTKSDLTFLCRLNFTQARYPL